MNCTTTKFGPGPVTYKDEELDQIISDYVAEINMEFSYNGICSQVVAKAVDENKVEGAHHTKYTRNDLSAKDGYRVSRILWEKIWEKEIFIAFGKKTYMAHTNDDTRFLKYQLKIIWERL